MYIHLIIYFNVSKIFSGSWILRTVEYCVGACSHSVWETAIKDAEQCPAQAHVAAQPQNLYDVENATRTSEAVFF
jgi:hypothetical protein